MVRFTIPLVMVSALALGGCLFGQGAPPEDVVRTRASREFSCAQEKVQIEPLGGNSFRARACGSTATYSCMGGNVGNPYDAMCTREGSAESATAGQSAAR